MSEELSTKFNTNNLLSFNSADKEQRLSFGTYNGNAQLSIGSAKFEKGNTPPRNITLTPTILHNLKAIISDIVKSPAPGKKRTLTFNGFWNEASRKRELSLLITIGMDDAAICYIGVKHVDKDKGTVSGKFDLVGDRNVTVSEMYDDDKSRSMVTLKMLEAYFNNMYFEFTALLNRNHLRKFNGGATASKTGSSTSLASKGYESDDEPF